MGEEDPRFRIAHLMTTIVGLADKADHEAVNDAEAKALLPFYTGLIRSQALWVERWMRQKPVAPTAALAADPQPAAGEEGS